MKNEFMNVPIFTGEGKVHFEERKIPTPGDNQLLIQAKANLLCGSDRNQFYNGSPQCIPGHEGADAGWKRTGTAGRRVRLGEG